MSANDWQTNITVKPTRVDVRANLVLSSSRWWVRRPPPVAALRCSRATHPPLVLRKSVMHANHRRPHITLKPARVGVRADDIGAKRLEEACIPRDGGLRGEVQCTENSKRERGGGYIAQMRGGTVGMRQMSARQPIHTDLSK